MATYYVATTGNDNNVGSEVSPWLTIQKAVNTMVAGDTTIVENGVYNYGGSPLGGVPRVVWIGSGSGGTASHGTPSNRITLKARNIWGAKIRTPNVAGTRQGIGIARNYWTIENFEIEGSNASSGTGPDGGIVIPSPGCTGLIIRYNWIHRIGRFCSGSNQGQPGITMATSTDCVIEWNRIHDIGMYNGRSTVQENGCTLTPNNDNSDPSHDHAVYVSGGTDITVRHNLLYDCVAGYPIHIYKSSGVFTRIKVYNNTCARRSTTAVTRPTSHILISANHTDFEAKNNLSYDPLVGMFGNLSLTSTNGVISHNQCSKDTLGKTTGWPAGMTFSNNVQDTSPGFINQAGDNFRLAANSAAIGSGTNVGLPFNGTAPSKGCFDPPRFSSAAVGVVTSGSNSVIKVFLTCNVAPPLLPATGVTGFTCRVNGAARTITSAAVVNNTEVHLTLASPVTQGQTVDISYSNGNLTDSAFKGMMPQPVTQTLTNQPVTNAVVSPSVAPAAPTGVTVALL